MIDRTLIRRYVAAVYRLAADAGQVEPVREELARLQEAVTRDPRTLEVLQHPGITVAEKRDLLRKVAGEAPSTTVAGLLDVLLEKHRAEVLLGASDVFTDFADEDAGRVRAFVEVAWEPDAEQQQRLQSALARLVGRPVVAEFKLVPEILGGARVHLLGRVMDGSLQGWLQEMVGRIATAPSS
ncbi:ATP synthase F1 subunit delta [bacterium]|nr:ATP synthase F1 subunit delta [bacterium]